MEFVDEETQFMTCTHEWYNRIMYKIRFLSLLTEWGHFYKRFVDEKTNTPIQSIFLGVNSIMSII